MATIMHGDEAKPENTKTSGEPAEDDVEQISKESGAGKPKNLKRARQASEENDDPAQPPAEAKTSP